MQLALIGLLTIFGTYRLLRSWRTGVFQLKFSTVSRAEQPQRFASNMAFLGTGVLLAWVLLVRELLTMHLAVSFSRAAT